LTTNVIASLCIFWSSKFTIGRVFKIQRDVFKWNRM